jgi:anti-sigma B factor antagonist
MSVPKIKTSVRQVGDRVCVVDISGEITSFAEGPLMDAYTQANTHQASIIALNFSDLDYMNSSGIGLLVTLLIRAQRQDQELLAFGLNDHYKQIFELTRLNEAIQIFPSEVDALSAAKAI